MDSLREFEVSPQARILNKPLKRLQKLRLGALEAIFGLFRAVAGLSGESVDLFWALLGCLRTLFALS